MYRILITTLLLFLIGCQQDAVVIPSQSSYQQQDKGLERPVPPVQGSIKKRVALVIGNADYKFAPLRNPVNDAKDMAKALRSVNFHVIYKTNASWTEMDDGIEEFSGLLGKGVVGLFYFSGHGVQLEDKNYLLPTDMEKPSIRKVKHRSISASYVLTAMKGAGNTMNILILDACRDNPFKGLSKSIGIGKGLARMKDVPTGTLIAYATSPGDTAADGSGRNSPYTAGLLANLHEPNLPIEMMFKQVRNAVLKNTGNRQTPWESSSLKGENFYFVKKKTVVASAGDTPPVVPVVPVNTGQSAEIARLREQAAEAEARAERERQARIAAENRAKKEEREQAEIERLRRQKAKADAKAERERLARLEAEKRRKKTSKVFRDTLSIGGKGPEMVRIPAGSFRMGDIQGGGGSDEKPVHRVSVGAFAMGKYEVTVGEFKRFVKSSRYTTDAEKKGSCYTYKNGSWGYKKGANWRNPSFSQNNNHPVTCVSWNDATAYTKWLSQQTGKKYRLPTEAEWEYAARAGTSTKRYWGNNPDKACTYANVADKTAKKKFSDWTIHNCADGYTYTAPVGQKQPNAFGLFDVLGNVWEWTCSEYESKYQGKEKTCKNRAAYFALRGGSWGDKPTRSRSAFRFRLDPSGRGRFDGLRLIRTK